MTSIERRDADFRDWYGFGLPTALPRYRAARIGRTTIDPVPGFPSDAGYVSRHVVERPHHVLSRDRVAWMSTSSLELESHAWHLSRARGRVVVAGLGLGMIVHAMAAKPEVDAILVVDVDPTIPEILEASSELSGWRGRDRVSIEILDALGPSFPLRARELGFHRPDYLYVDIWSCFPHQAAPRQTATMAAALSPVEAGWWTQELHLGLWCRDRRQAIDAGSADAFFRETGISVAVDDGYLAFCRDACETAGIATTPTNARATA